MSLSGNRKKSRMVTEKGKEGQVHKKLEGDAGPKHSGLSQLIAESGKMLLESSGRWSDN